jgi:hypothetical protein
MPRGFRPDGSLSKAANGEWADGSPSRLATVAAMTVDHPRWGTGTHPRYRRSSLASSFLKTAWLSRSLDNSAYGQ